MLRSWIPLEKIFSYNLCKNPHPGAFTLIENNPDKVYWNNIVTIHNSKSMNIVEKKIRKLHLNLLCEQIISDDDFRSQIRNSLDILSMESYDIEKYILEKNPDEINWRYLCMNPNAIPYIEKELSKNRLNIKSLDWINLSSNPGASHLLEKYMDKIKED